MVRALAYICLGIVLSFLGILFLRGNEDSWICQHGVWVQHGHPKATIPTIPCPNRSGSMKLTSSEFSDGSELPAKYACQGDSVSPPFSISGVPTAAKSLAFVLEDPDAPHGNYVHFLVWNISPETTMIPKDQIPADAVLGNNSAGTIGLTPPCPPFGTHRYVFTLYALDTALDLPSGATKAEFDTAAAKHKISEATLTARYAKQ